MHLPSFEHQSRILEHPPQISCQIDGAFPCLEAAFIDSAQDVVREEPGRGVAFWIVQVFFGYDLGTDVEEIPARKTPRRVSSACWADLMSGIGNLRRKFGKLSVDLVSQARAPQGEQCKPRQEDGGDASPSPLRHAVVAPEGPVASSQRPAWRSPSQHGLHRPQCPH